MKEKRFEHKIRLPLYVFKAFYCLIILILVAGCSKTEDAKEIESKAIKGIAFLILDANFNESTSPGTKAGIEYSRYWLQKQEDSLKADLQMRCDILAELVVDLNMLFLQDMISKSKLPFLLEDSKRKELESIVNQNSDFSYEWSIFKIDQSKNMKPRIVQYRDQLKENNESKSLIIKATKETYLESQPLLLEAMRKRIREIFVP